MDWFSYDRDLRHERVKQPVKYLQWRFYPFSCLTRRLLPMNSLGVFDHFLVCLTIFCLGVSEPTKRLAAQSTAYALRN